MSSVVTFRWRATRYSPTVSLLGCVTLFLCGYFSGEGVQSVLGQELEPVPTSVQPVAQPVQPEQLNPKALLESILGPDTDEKPAQAPPNIVILQTPNDAVIAAVNDINLLLQSAEAWGEILDTSVYRYVWIPDGNIQDQALVSFVLNSVVSRSDINYVPGRPRSPIQVLDNGRLMRINMRELAPLNQGEDYESITSTWDKMFNPYFLIEKNEVKVLESIKQVLIVKREQVRVQVGSDIVALLDIDTELDVVDIVVKGGNKWCQIDWEGETGFVLLDNKIKIIDQQEEIIEDKIDFKTNVFGPHIDLDAASALQGATSDDIAHLTINPIIWCRSLYKAALTQIDDGLYYEFKGIRPANEQEKEKGLSDLDVFLVAKGVSEDLITKLRADQRVAMITSQVTGKPRRIDVFDRPARIGNNQGLVVITQDMLDGDYNAGADPFMNLINFVVGGKELIYEENNGHLGYILFDGKGNLVNEAPPNLVADHTIPAPFTRRLQPAISCIRCHGRNESAGWIPFTNDIRTALAGFLNAYEDKDGVRQKQDLPETLETLARLYQGILDKPMRRAREDLSDAIVITTGDARNARGLPWQYEDVSNALAERFVYYDYTAVTPLIACEELGYRVEDPGQAVTLLNRLLGRLDSVIGVPVQMEDVRLGLLKQDIPINRFQWELVYVDAALRARRNTAQILQQQQKQK